MNREQLKVKYVLQEKGESLESFEARVNEQCNPEKGFDYLVMPFPSSYGRLSCIIHMYKEFVPDEKTSGLNFGQALEALKAGKKVCRSGWNGKNMFIYLTEPSLVTEARHPILKEMNDKGITAEICGHIDMKAADGKITIGWCASQIDMLANDWEIHFPGVPFIRV